MCSSRTRQRSGATSHAHQPHTTTGMGQDELWQRPTATQTSLEQGEGIWKAEDEDGERPTHPHVLSLLSICVCIRSFAVFFFPSSPSALTQRLSANLRAWHKPYAAPCLRPPGEVLSGLQRLQVFQCYVVAEMILLLFGEREGRVKNPNCFSKLPRSKAKQVSAALRKSC